LLDAALVQLLAERALAAPGDVGWATDKYRRRT
jgi:hypothetical protein